MTNIDMAAFGKLLDDANLMARKQDGQIILYNRQPKFISKGILVADLNAAQRMVLQYLRSMQTSGFTALTDFASSASIRALPFKEVDNRVDEQSAYFVQKTAMSSISRINLLLAAKALRERVEASALSRVVQEKVTKADVKRYLKLKQAAASHLEGAEKIT